VVAYDTQGGVAQFDGHGLARVGHADVDALAGDLDPAAAGDSPLDSLAPPIHAGHMPSAVSEPSVFPAVFRVHLAVAMVVLNKD
jgi:hypothetical protein